MSKKLPLTDFRAVRSMLEPHEFAISEGQDAAPSDPVEQEVWEEIMHLPEDVSIRISDHNGTRLKLLHSLSSDWRTAIGDPERPDEIYNCMLDAGDCFQCAIFNFLHGYYRASLAELRVALELVMIGTYGSLKPTDEKYSAWKRGVGELSFTRCRKNLSGILRKGDAKWMFGDDEFLATSYQTLCGYTHSRPDASDGALWQSNGPVNNNEAIRMTFFRTLSVFAICYLLVRLARRGFVMPSDSDILFELEWMPNYAKLVRLSPSCTERPPASHARLTFPRRVAGTMLKRPKLAATPDRFATEFSWNFSANILVRHGCYSPRLGER